MRKNSSKSRFLLSSFQDQPVFACPSHLLPVEIDIVHRYPDLLPIHHLSTEDARTLLRRYRKDDPYGAYETAFEVHIVDARHQFYVDVVVRDVSPKPAPAIESPDIPAWFAYCQLFATHPFLPPNGEYDPTQPPYGL
jgi:hypothetical protein